MFFKKYSLVLCSLCLLLSCTQQNDSEKKATSMPNFVWIIAEDISPHLGCYGEELVHTPAIDMLAENGVRFTNAYSCSGTGAPSRAAIFTGMYSTIIGTHHSKQERTGGPEPPHPSYVAVPEPYIKAFPEFLKAAGYYTSNSWKTNYQFDEPFTMWDDCSLGAHWRNRPEGMPFFSCFTFETTHELNVWPDSTKYRYFDEHNIDTVLLVPNMVRRPPLDGQYITEPSDIVLPPYYPDSEIIRADMARQLTNISRLDGQVQKLIDQLYEDGLLENTIIFFLSDNGNALPRAKRWIYDSGTRVPLIIYYPEAMDPEVREDLISLTDLAPTVLKMAGLHVPEHIHGKDIFSDLKQEPREYVMMGRDRIHSSYDMIRGVRGKRFQYIKNFNPEAPYTREADIMYELPSMKEIIALEKKDALTHLQSYWLFESKPPEELYDCLEDPYQVNNLADNPAYEEILISMRDTLFRWQEEYGDWGFMPEKEQAELMWPGGKQPRTAHPVIQVSDQTMTLSCATEGATIAYQLQSEGTKIWHIYQEPVLVKQGETIIVKAIRYGHFESRLMALDLNQQ